MGEVAVGGGGVGNVSKTLVFKCLNTFVCNSKPVCDKIILVVLN